eukprot:gene39141-47620_t
MATKDDSSAQIDDVEPEEDIASGVSAEKRREAKGVDSVTDYVQEKSAADEGKLQSALGAITSVNDVSSSSTAAVIKEEDVKSLVEDCEISREQAEALLRKHEGNVRAAMTHFATGQPLL